MNNSCNCESCVVNQQVQHKTTLNSAWFKENTRKIAELVDEVLEENRPSTNNSKKKSTFHISISEYNEKDGYALEYNRVINVEEFAMLLEDIFGIETDLFYTENDGPTVEDDILVFKSLDEVINFLNNKKESEE